MNAQGWENYRVFLGEFVSKLEINSFTLIQEVADYGIKIGPFKYAIALLHSSKADLSEV